MQPVGACLGPTGDGAPGETANRSTESQKVPAPGGDAAERRAASLSRILREWTATLDAIQDMISVHGEDFRIVRVNRSLARFFGREPAELIGEPCYRVFHGTDEPWPQCPHREAQSSRTTVTTEVMDPHLGVPLQITCSPYTDERGAFVGTVHVARDISEPKARERERQELIEKLREAVARAKLLSGLLPICSSCKKIRDDQGYWNQLEAYISKHSEAQFTHGICPECTQELYPGRTRPSRK